MVTNKFRKMVLLASAAAVVGFTPAIGAAQSVDSVLNVEKQAATTLRQSQTRIDKLDDETQDLLGTYQTVAQTVDDLRIFNAQLSAQVQDQVQQINELEQSIDDIAVIRRQVTPEMVQMVDALGSFVDKDMPFRSEERLARVEKVKGYLTEGDISEAERFRQILEAYSQEVEYGRTVEAYSGPVVHEGTTYDNVQFLRVGRVGLYYKGLDNNTTVVGFYNKATNTFEALDKSYAATIKNGIDFANNTANPELLMLPVLTPEGR